MPWFVPLIMSLVSTAVGTGSSIINNNKQRRFQEQQLAKEQQLNNEINTNNKLTTLNNQINENNQFSNQFASNLNKGYSTGLLSNQMPAGTGVGVQGLTSIFLKFFLFSSCRACASVMPITLGMDSMISPEE